MTWTLTLEGREIPLTQSEWLYLSKMLEKVGGSAGVFIEFTPESLGEEVRLGSTSSASLRQE